MHWRVVAPFLSPAISLAEKAVNWYLNSKKSTALV
jgi:hypothetical protein